LWWGVKTTKKKPLPRRRGKKKERVNIKKECTPDREKKRLANQVGVQRLLEGWGAIYWGRGHVYGKKKTLAEKVCFLLVMCARKEGKGRTWLFAKEKRSFFNLVPGRKTIEEKEKKTQNEGAQKTPKRRAVYPKKGGKKKKPACNQRTSRALSTKKGKGAMAQVT